MYPFILTLIAGLSTLLGTLPIFIKFKNTNKIIASSCSFAAGIMICISIFDLIPESNLYLKNYFKSPLTAIIIFIFILLGIFLSYIIDISIDRIDNNKPLYKVGLLSMLVIILHNIPEGIVTYIVSKNNLIMGLGLCIAIALHNIPEGITIALPIYYSTKNKSLAIKYTFIAAISEVFGAFISYLFLSKYINNLVLGLLFSVIGGLMLEISFSKLIPTSLNYHQKTCKIFLLIGVIFMLISLILNKLINYSSTISLSLLNKDLRDFLIILFPSMDIL